jgi:hypothetical protein
MMASSSTTATSLLGIGMDRLEFHARSERQGMIERSLRDN